MPLTPEQTSMISNLTAMQAGNNQYSPNFLQTLFTLCSLPVPTQNQLNPDFVTAEDIEHMQKMSFYQEDRVANLDDKYYGINATDTNIFLQVLCRDNFVNPLIAQKNEKAYQQPVIVTQNIAFNPNSADTDNIQQYFALYLTKIIADRQNNLPPPYKIIMPFSRDAHGLNMVIEINPQREFRVTVTNPWSEAYKTLAQSNYAIIVNTLSDRGFVNQTNELMFGLNLHSVQGPCGLAQCKMAELIITACKEPANVNQFLDFEALGKDLPGAGKLATVADRGGENRDLEKDFWRQYLRDVRARCEIIKPNASIAQQLGKDIAKPCLKPDAIILKNMLFEQTPVLFLSFRKELFGKDLQNFEMFAKQVRKFLLGKNIPRDCLSIITQQPLNSGQYGFLIKADVNEVAAMLQDMNIDLSNINNAPVIDQQSSTQEHTQPPVTPQFDAAAQAAQQNNPETGAAPTPNNDPQAVKATINSNPANTTDPAPSFMSEWIKINAALEPSSAKYQFKYNQPDYALLVSLNEREVMRVSKPNADGSTSLTHDGSENAWRATILGMLANKHTYCAFGFEEIPGVSLQKLAEEFVHELEKLLADPIVDLDALSTIQYAFNNKQTILAIQEAMKESEQVQALFGVQLLNNQFVVKLDNSAAAATNAKALLGPSAPRISPPV